MTYANYPSLHGKHVFVTGGASGIGRSIVEHLLNQNALVSFVDVDTKEAETLNHPYVFFQHCDIRDINALKKAIQSARDKFGVFSGLVNNAANDDRHNIPDVTPEYWDNSFNINLRPHFFTAQQLQHDLKETKGSIVNISSNSYLLRVARMPAYLAAKAAIVGLTRALARDMGPDAIRVNVVLPGWVMTKRQEERWLTPEAEEELLQTQCLKEKLYPDDISRFILFLLANDSKMISGQEFILDGGRA
jgi:D-xylose 1-dehydrogenase